jgi:hypothetical protein
MSRKGTSWFNNSLALTPRSAGATPGRKRTPTISIPAVVSGREVIVAGPATNGSPPIQMTSMQPSGSTKPFLGSGLATRRQKHSICPRKSAGGGISW